MREITKIILHCADTPEGVYFDIDDINEWHLARGFSGCGYHYVVLLDGTLQRGREEKTVGAHARGHNSKSIGVCYIGGKGGDTRTPEQKKSLSTLIKYLKLMYPKASVLGHRDLPNVTKSCPSFDAKTEYKYY